MKKNNFIHLLFFSIFTLGGVLFLNASKASAATLYFNGVSDTGHDWNDLSNWWTDAAFTSQASSLPSQNDEVIILTYVNLNSGSEPTVKTLTVNGEYNSIYMSISVTDLATFNDLSQNWGHITGDVVFNDSSTNWGSVIGNATFNDLSYNYYGSVSGIATFTNANDGLMTVPNGSSWWDIEAGSIVGSDGKPITSWSFKGNSYNTGTISNNPVFNEDSYNYGIIEGNATFNDSSYNDLTITGNAVFNDLSCNNKDVYEDATFNGIHSKNKGTVNGTKTRRFVFDMITDMNFVTDGPWTVLADGADVNVFRATYDSDTTFQVANGGHFDYDEPVYDGPTEKIMKSNDFIGGGIAQGWNDDDNYWTYNLPFKFKFFGKEYVKVYVSSNGYLGFTEDGDMSNYDFTLADGNGGSPIIAALKKDLLTNENDGDDIYVTDNGDGKVIFRWQATDIDNTDNILNFEIVLNSDNTFKINYGDQSVPFSKDSGVAAAGVNNGGGLYLASAYDGRLDYNRLNSTLWAVLGNESQPINDGPTSEKFQQDIQSGFILISGSEPAKADMVTFNTDYTITQGDATIQLPAGTEMTNSEGGTLDFTQMDMEDMTNALRSSNTVNIAGAISIGIPNLKLKFSKDITITIPVDQQYNGQTLNIWYQNQGESNWNQGPTCTVQAGLCTFQTDHATTYSAGDKPSDETVDLPEIKKPKIESWKAYLQESDSKCATKLKLNLEGKNFNKDIEVRIGNKKADSVKRKSSKQLTASFCYDKLTNIQTDLSRKIKVANPGAKETKADSKIDLQTVFKKFTQSDFSTQVSDGIKNIQQALVKLGMLGFEKITGTYDSDTSSAVRNFQQENDLPTTGQVGPLTRQQLEKQYWKAL